MKNIWDQLADALVAPFADAVHGELAWTGVDGSHLHVLETDDGTTWTIIDRAGFVRHTRVLAPETVDSHYT